MVQIFQKKSGHILGHQCFQLEVDIPFLKFQETHHSEVLELVPEFFSSFTKVSERRPLWSNLIK